MLADRRRQTFGRRPSAMFFYFSCVKVFDSATHVLSNYENESVERVKCEKEERRWRHRGRHLTALSVVD